MIDIIDTCDLKNGDTYRELGRAGDQVLVGTVTELIDCQEHEDAGATVWKQIGEGEDAYREAVARA